MAGNPAARLKIGQIIFVAKKHAREQFNRQKILRQIQLSQAQRKMSYGFGIGDFLAVGNLAYVLYNDLIKVARGAPEEFRLLVHELTTLHTMMRSFDEEFKNKDSVLARAGQDRHKLIGEILARINTTLKALNVCFEKHRNLGSTARKGIKRSWDKIKWALDVKDVDELRSKVYKGQDFMYRGGADEWSPRGFSS